MIDIDTPAAAHNIKGYHTGADMELVFSDEFNTDGRTFYPGDDPYWEAVDLHYWQVSKLSITLCSPARTPLMILCFSCTPLRVAHTDR